MKKGGDGGDETKAPTPTGEEVDFKKIPIAEALRVLKATEQGLTSAEHKKRLEEYGPNKLPESSRNPILVYLGYMWNPLSWAMEVALIVSICLLDYADFCLIIALLLCNATISYVEESNADKAIKALTAALAPKAKCLRDGTVSTIDAQELVPGDIIVVRLGEIVPADIKLLGETGEDDHPMQVDQAALTGESLPVKKFSGDVCFSGSSIKQGEKHAVVYATGSNTFFGRAAALIGATNNVANIQKIMTKIGGVCLVTIGIWVIIELAVQFGHYGHSCKSGAGNCPTLTNMLVIIVGGIPIAMPTVLSVTLALGAYKLAKEGAIVARMSAVEEMAGMDILCSDKTGTLTLNKLSVDANIVFPMGGHQPQDVLKYAALSAQKNSEEAIDRVLAESYPGYEQLWNQYEISKFIPFNPVDKYTIAYVTDKQSGETYRLMKGAPQIVLKHAYNYQEVATVGNQKITEFANRGFRALGVARGPAQGAIKDAKWEMVGLLPLFDPPRHDTKETIERCLEKGLLVKMITGDQALIGKETAKQLGMGHNIFNTEVLLRAKEGKGFPEGFSSLKELVEKADGFAEVFPEHKFLIVELLKKERHIVGMTGDGVNDAPALKKADVGIAVDGATDAARGAADIVLTKPGLATIVTAIIGSRKIFQRMTTYSKYTVAMTFRICFTFGLLTVLYNWYFPTILIVLLAVFNDGAMIALSKDRVTASTLPNSWDLKNIFISGIVYGLYLTLSSWVYFFVITHTDFPRDNLKMFTLNLRQRELARYCNQYIPTLGLDPTASVCTVPQYQGQGPACIPPTGGVEAEGITVFDQCMAEQYYIRASIARTAIYSHVSISGQALVFVVRCKGWSLLARAGVWTYLAFMIAQIMATIISAIGFGGYEYPNDGFGNCQFCRLVYGSDLRTGGRPPFMHAYNVPRAFSEDVHQSSVVACTYYVVFSWIWAIIWYLGLDPIKWVLAYILDEDGARTGKHLPAGSEAGPKASEPETHGIMSGQVSRHNPLGRVSVSRPSPAQLERASIARVGPMPPPPPRTSLGRLSMGRQSLGRTSKDQAKSVV
jgi:H+-transporting ATPase